MLDEQTLLTIKQAADLLGIHRQTVYQAIRDGRLPAITVLGHVTVRKEDVEAYRARQARIGPLGGRPRKERRPAGRPKKQKEEPTP